MEDTKEHINTKERDSMGEDDAIVESDVELDNTDVVEPDNDTPQKVIVRNIGCICNVITVWHMLSLSLSRAFFLNEVFLESMHVSFFNCRWEIYPLKLQKRCKMLHKLQNQRL